MAASSVRSAGAVRRRHGSGTSPIIVGDLVVLANDQEDPNRPGEARQPARAARPEEFLIAVDRKTGQHAVAGRPPTASPAYSTPCLYKGTVPPN